MSIGIVTFVARLRFSDRFLVLCTELLGQTATQKTLYHLLQMQHTQLAE